jgi:hypothetical protein
MARLPRAGSRIAGIYERTPEIDQLIEAGVVHPRECLTTLDDVVSRLNLKLSEEDKQKIRDDLGAVIGLGLQQFEYSPKSNPDSGLQVRDVIRTLRRTAKRLDRLAAGKLDPAELSKIEQVIHGTQTGFRESHHIAAAGCLMSTLTGEDRVKNLDRVLRAATLRARLSTATETDADTFLSEIDLENTKDTANNLVREYHNHPAKIADACRKAALVLGRIRGVSARPKIDWFPQFVAVLLFVAERNGISPKVSIDWRTYQPLGDFFRLAFEFQKLLHFSMRVTEDPALAQRVKRALRTLGTPASRNS